MAVVSSEPFLAPSRLFKLASVLAFVGTAALSIDAHAQDAERGQRLYENHCRKCHTAAVHGRNNRTAMSLRELRRIVDRWQADQALGWRDAEIDDVVRYLSTTRYFIQAAR